MGRRVEFDQARFNSKQGRSNNMSDQFERRTRITIQILTLLGIWFLVFTDRYWIHAARRSFDGKVTVSPLANSGVRARFEGPVAIDAPNSSIASASWPLFDAVALRVAGEDPNHGGTVLGVQFASDVGTSSPELVGYRSRGRMSDPQNAQTGDELLKIGVAGFGAGAFQQGGFIQFEADDGWGDTRNDAPTRIRLALSPDGSDVPETAMLIRANGNVGIGTEPCERLHVSVKGNSTNHPVALKLESRSNDQTAARGVKIALAVTGKETTPGTIAEIEGQCEGERSDLIFRTGRGGSAEERLRVSDDGLSTQGHVRIGGALIFRTRENLKVSGCEIPKTDGGRCLFSGRAGEAAREPIWSN